MQDCKSNERGYVMKLKSEFYGDVSNYVMNERKALADLHEQLKAVEHDIFSNDKRFTPKYIRSSIQSAKL